MRLSDSHKQGDICRRDYLDSVLDFFFSTALGRTWCLRFFKWKPATNPFAFVLRIENSGDVAQQLTHFVTSFLATFETRMCLIALSSNGSTYVFHGQFLRHLTELPMVLEESVLLLG